MCAMSWTFDRQLRNGKSRTFNDKHSWKAKKKNGLMIGGLHIYDPADLLYEDVSHCFANNDSPRICSLGPSQAPGDASIRPDSDVIIALVCLKNLQIIQKDSEAMDERYGDHHTNHSF